MHAQEAESESLSEAACRICPGMEAESDSANAGVEDHIPVHLSSTPLVEVVMLSARAGWHIWISGERPSGMLYLGNGRLGEEGNKRVLRAAVKWELVGGMKVMSNAPCDDQMICAF
jgi:hypothetical protein